MSERREIPLHEIAIGIFDGPHATPPEATDGPLFLRIDNITPEGRLDLSEQRYISPQDFPRWTRRVTPEPGDVVFSYEATLHRYVVIPEGFYGCLGRRLALVRPDRKLVESEYLHYYFLTDQWRRTAATAIINGATVDRISLTRIRDLMLDLPSLKIQRNVINILSAYDDLIENNRRRMALLEESARQLYREWFVRLRFPGHEHTRIVDGVPEEWERVALGAIVDVQSGFAFKSSTYLQSGAYGIVTIKNVHNGHFICEVDAFLDDLPSKMPSHCRLTTGDILLSLTGNIGRTCLVTGDDYLLNQRVAKLVPRTGFSRAFAYFTFREENLQKRIEAISYGVAQQNLSPVKMRDLSVELPPKNFIRQFSDFADIAIDQILNLKQQNQKLRAARDLLLPRLMSGEIAV